MVVVAVAVIRQVTVFNSVRVLLSLYIYVIPILYNIHVHSFFYHIQYFYIN